MNLLNKLTSTTILSNTKFGEVIQANKILVLSPHHDDEVLGLGGSLLEYSRNGTEIEIIYITDGSKGIADGRENVRLEEAIEVWKNYKSNIKQYFWNLKDGQVEQCEGEFTNKLKQVLGSFKPDIIYVPWVLDIHKDHQYTAIYLKKVLLELHLENILIASYEVMSPLLSNHTVNITKYYAEKMQLINIYKSQHSYLSIVETTENLNKFRASMLRLKSVKYAEGFCAMAPIDFILFIDSLTQNVANDL